LAIVAQHHDLAGDTAQSIPAYLAAAAATQAEASHSEARRLLDRALELLDAAPLGEERDLTELNARLLRSVSVSSQFGYAYPDVLEDFQVAHGICRRYRDRPEILPAELGIWSHLFVGGDRGAASTVLEPLKQSAGGPEFSWFEPELKSCFGFDAIYGGELAEARSWLEDAWAIYLTRPAEARVSGFWPLPNDPVPVTAIGLACIAGLQGRTSDSAEWERLALATAEQIGFPRGPFSLAFVTTYLAWLRIVTGDAAGARSFGRRTIEIGNQHRFDYFAVLGRQYALFPEVDRPSDPVELEQCAVAMDLVGHAAFRPAYLGIVARNDAYLGHWDEALEHVDDGLTCVIKSGELVHQPDLLRLRAEITAAGRPDEVDEVVSDLRAAVDSGLAQDSFVFALRAANDLARLPAGDRPDDWRQVLETALHRFPDDSASPERRDALGLLGS
jgi:hypothetical protein